MRYEAIPVGAMTPRLEALHTLVQAFEPKAVATPDIWSCLRGKLGYGAVLFAQALEPVRIKRPRLSRTGTRENKA